MRAVLSPPAPRPARAELIAASLGMVCFRVNPGGLGEDALAQTESEGPGAHLLGRAGVFVVHDGQ